MKMTHKATSHYHTKISVINSTSHYVHPFNRLPLCVLSAELTRFLRVVLYALHEIAYALLEAEGHLLQQLLHALGIHEVAEPL